MFLSVSSGLIPDEIVARSTFGVVAVLLLGILVAGRLLSLYATATLSPDPPTRFGWSFRVGC